MKKLLAIIFVGAVFLRLLLMPSFYHGDLNNNISWGNLLLERGTNGFYGSSDANDWPYSAPNQPPLYLLTFGLTSWLDINIETIAFRLNDNWQAFPSKFIWFWQESGATVTVKLPGIIADIGIGALIFTYFNRKKKKKLALLLSTLWLFNPVTWYNSAVWGQTDSVVNFFGLASVLSLISGNIILCTFLFTLGFLYKGSLVIFIPILIIYALSKKLSLKEYIKALVLLTGLVFMLSLPFYPFFDFPIWFINLYKERIMPGEIGYLTANAFNFWWLINPGKVLDSTKYLLLQARAWGLLLTLTLVGLVSYSFYKKPKEKNLFFSLALVAMLSFIFMTRMHERYLYPFFPYVTILIGFSPLTLIAYIAISVVHLLNLYHLFWQPSIPVLIDIYSYEWLPNLLSLFTIILLFSYIYLFKSRPKGKIKRV